MKASFTYAIRYLVSAVCASPLRTGNADNDADRVLTTPDGFALLQGTSIAGAMKAWFENEAAARDLFGGVDRESAVRVSDAVFEQKAVAETRPRVCIDGRTGTSANKYDVAGLPTGARCSFELIWRGAREAAEEAADRLERCLSAIDSGEITLGAQRSNGYGRVKLTVRKREYDLFKEADRLAWLDDSTADARPVVLESRAEKEIVFDVEAFLDAVLVKASTSERRNVKQNVQVQFTENGEPILPGSSLKGAMRAHMTRIAPFLSVSGEELERLLGRMARGEDTGVAGKLVWTDAKPDADTRSAVVTRIRLNKLTGGVMQRSLLTEEPVSGLWRWQIRVPAAERRGALLVLYALRDLGLGLYQLGGTQAVGRGAVGRLTVGIRSGEDRAVLSVRDRTPGLEDPAGITAAWEAAMGGN